MIEKSLEYFKNRLSKPLSDKRREAYQDAVESLEKQVAMMPTKKEDYFEGDYFLIYKCPKCEYVLGIGVPHCPYCGQRLDWSE